MKLTRRDLAGSPALASGAARPDGDETRTLTAITSTGGKTANYGGGPSLSSVTSRRSRNSSGGYTGPHAARAGGGIALASLSGTVTVQDSTITGNISSSGGGGGISKTSSTGSLVLTNTVVALNTNVTNPDVLASGTVTANNSFLGSASAL